MKFNKKLLDIFKKTKTTSDEYTYTCSYINTELDKKLGYTKSNADSNGWIKIDLGLCKMYIKQSNTSSITFSANGWAGETLTNLPTDISSYNTNKHFLLGTASAMDNAVDVDIIPIRSGDSTIYANWRNKYGGAVTSNIRYNLALFVFE